MHKRIMMPLAIVMTMLMATMSVAAVSANHDNDGVTHEFGDPAFETTWERTDLPVETGEAVRTWIWGPEPFTDDMMEPYAESPDGERKVQYFDKSRMEINDPAAFNDGLWYVTNGLLVVEMVEGWYQIGDAEFDETPEPAEVNVTGDPGDETGLSPTYADINTYGLRDEPARADGSVIVQTIDAEGVMGTDDTKTQYNVTSAFRYQEPGIDHQVASVFWDFMNSEGTVYENGAYVEELLFESPVYATGLPITEAYWSSVMVNGSERDVLWQCFERRCLTYTPGNPDGFLVEAGNVGQHFYRWQYGDVDPGPEPQEYEIQFGSLNGSGVTGSAQVTLTGAELVVDLQASGLEEGAHLWHIHGMADGTDASCPTMALDANGNGFIELAEGVPAYGDVLVAFEDLTVDATGTVDTTVTVTLTEEQLTDLGNFLNNVFVIHGMTADLNTEDEVEAVYEASLPAACGDVNEPGFFDEAEAHDVDLGELNASGVTGTAHLELLGDLLTVELSLTGLEADQMHAMHIHGLETGDASCPTEELDTNDNGFVELEEGLPAYGGVLLTLGMPTPDETGALEFSGSYIVDPAALGDLLTRAIVVHGLTADLDGDGPGEAEYVGSLPVACGDLDTPDEPAPTEVYNVTLDAQNESGVSGMALFSLDGDQLSVTVQASGLTPDEAHAMHIHGLETGQAACPTIADDTNADGFVDLTEGTLIYGGVLYAIGAPMADAEGNLLFEVTLTVDPATLLPFEELGVVIHGLSIDPDGDGELPAVYNELMPVACGIVEAAGAEATADIMDTSGSAVGSAHLVETAAGVLVHVEVTAGVAAGPHGVSINAVGDCTGDFASAGDHFNPGAGLHGTHAGDLGNVVVLEDMTGDLFLLAAGITLGEGATSLLDADGSALVIYAGEDDMTTDPDGNAGSRVACGVITSTTAAP